MARHIALIGDSIFDNHSYVRTEPDVISHLRKLLPSSWQATLCAVDGSLTEHLRSQIKHLPVGTTHLVISSGGNDALSHLNLLAAPASSTAEALGAFVKPLQTFEADYRSVLQQALNLALPTTLCTIYNGNLQPEIAPLARLALTMFNDVILRVAFENRLAVIDLRLICNQTEDYANPIEPSGSGGYKIALAIAQSLGAIPNKQPGSCVLSSIH